MSDDLPLYAYSRYVNGLRSDVQRYRLAWTSARQRAANFWLVIEHAEEEVTALRARLAELDAEAVESILERDEARAEVVRLGRKCEELIEENAQLRRDRAWEAKRANEAARLSADARDDAEARDAVIADLQEHVQIVESDRLTMFAWAVNLLTEHGIEYQVGEEFEAIARYIRHCKEDLATYRHVTDRSIQAREEYAQEAERLAGENTRLIGEVRLLREQPIRQGPGRGV